MTGQPNLLGVEATLHLTRAPVQQAQAGQKTGSRATKTSRNRSFLVRSKPALAIHPEHPTSSV